MEGGGWGWGSMIWLVLPLVKAARWEVDEIYAKSFVILSQDLLGDALYFSFHVLLDIVAKLHRSGSTLRIS
jgi:hypothetical protein